MKRGWLVALGVATEVVAAGFVLFAYWNGAGWAFIGILGGVAGLGLMAWGVGPTNEGS